MGSVSVRLPVRQIDALKTTAAGQPVPCTYSMLAALWLGRAIETETGEWCIFGTPGERETRETKGGE